MVMRLAMGETDFATKFDAFLAAKRGAQMDVDKAVREIIAAIRERGDAALCELTAQYDGLNITPDKLRVTAEEIAAAESQCGGESLAALDVAAQRISDFHARQKPSDDSYTDAAGVTLGHRWTPVAAAGLYVPGGTASYPSSVLMNGLPAKIAGVKRLVMAVPAPQGVLNPLVLAAARRVGVDEIYRIGGAQAIAALAYGTQSIAAVDMVVGPGNAYVAAAKRQVFGQVGIDMLAGPSEILIIADSDNDPDWVAADLLAQAEHDKTAQAILIIDDAAFGNQVAKAVQKRLANLSRAEIARASWEDFGAVIEVAALERDAPALIDQIAPEHLQLAVAAPEKWLEKFSNAGAIFMGRHTPEAIGDYVGGTNHVLPTGRTARFASGLAVPDFMKRSSITSCDADALAKIGKAAIKLAEEEGLDAHAQSVSVRLNK